MIPADELLEIKSRLLTGADAAYRIATSTGPVRYDHEEYVAVDTALLSLKRDISRVLAELDVLRGVFHTGVSMFLMEGANGRVPDAGGDVVAVPAPEAGGCGEGEQSNRQGTDGGVSESGVPGKRAKRSKSRRHRKADPAVSEPVGPRDGEGAVDSGTNA